MQNPANPSKPAGAGEALRTQGLGLQPNLSHQRSSRPGIRCQKRQKPRRATCGRGSCPKPQASEEEHGTRWKTKRRTKDATPMTPQTQQTELHRRSRTGNWSQKSLRNPLRVTCGRKRCGKTAGAARRETEANSSQWLNNSQPRAQQEERKKTQPCRPRKDPHTNAGTTSEEARSENHKASRRRRWPKRRRGIWSEKATP